MSMRTQPPPRGGSGGPVFLICLAVAATGFVLDFAFGARPHFWIAAQPGGAAAIGAVAAVFAALAARVAQLALSRGSGENKGARRP